MEFVFYELIKVTSQNMWSLKYFSFQNGSQEHNKKKIEHTEDYSTCRHQHFFKSDYKIKFGITKEKKQL